MAALAYLILQTLIVRLHGRDSELARAIGADLKGKLSFVLYLVAICVSFFQPWLAGCVDIAVALSWLIPDRRMEKILDSSGTG